jgi:hypothetical protein
MGIEDITLSMIDALAAEGIPYLLVGSLSSNYYGIPRSTQDADFVVQLGDKSISCIRKHLAPEFHIDPQVAFETITGTIKNVVRVTGQGFEIELFRLSNDAHDQERFRRRRSVILFDRGIYLPTPEDVIVTKLRWFRRKDYDDIQNVIAVQGDGLDWDYIDRWCREHKTGTQLEEIRRELLPPTDDTEPS